MSIPIPYTLSQVCKTAGKNLSEITIRCRYCSGVLSVLEILQVEEEAAETRDRLYPGFWARQKGQGIQWVSTCAKCRLFLTNA
ncbi:putative E6 protein [Francolinus leucoscepus papillomavirus 1]|uniref:Putative E6 protein n=1 Tax=Francolinus leucoscepus papillomavirus 1 TaxID=485362 RepID=C6ZD98_9PAPI|nr:putative E6 protein [Francolinus leucoscepus papillomavirus 1]ABX61084.1 putative E6 protein [Francolinus leucoscepus papillomavirus 1]